MGQYLGSLGSNGAMAGGGITGADATNAGQLTGMGPAAFKGSTYAGGQDVGSGILGGLQSLFSGTSGAQSGGTNQGASTGGQYKNFPSLIGNAMGGGGGGGGQRPGMQDIQTGMQALALLALL